MSYGGQSNAPWQRNMMQSHPQSGGFNQSSQMYMQNNMSTFVHGGMQGGGSGNMFPANSSGNGGGNSVSYPQPRTGLNAAAFQQSGGGQSHYKSIGNVTKISTDCGLVNDEVFFYRNVCKGPEPKLGDRVIFEATFSNNGQFKWNANRIQLMQTAQSLMLSNKNNYGTLGASNDYLRGQIRRNSPKRSPVRARRDQRERERPQRSRDKDEGEQERKKRREDVSRDRGVGVSKRNGVATNEKRIARTEKVRERQELRKKERETATKEREAAAKEREKERERIRDLEPHRVGPKGRRARAIRRYMVQIPKSVLTIKIIDIQELRQRYSSLYIPSDFFLANAKWSDTFTPDNPFSLRRPCQFHIMHETVESQNEQSIDLLEPADANYLYTAKVMLMSLPPIAEIYKKCFEADDDPEHNTVHPSRLINFLVGVKGRVGSMAIGGPWSPSLDGENPDEDPSVLIRTAIRTCKALTGIDLSNCTQWYRFVELYYHRTEYKNMERDGSPRVETVIIYLPDVHSCMPSIEEWQTLTQIYKNAADDVIARKSALIAAAAAAAAEAKANDVNEKSDDVEMAEDSAMADDDAEANSKEISTDNDITTTEDNEGDGDVESTDETEQEEKTDVPVVSVDLTEAADDDDNNAEVSCADDEEHAEDDTVADDENDEPAPEPTHYSLLDLKTMKVQEIRDELLARNLPDKGVRNVVMARLAKALNNEKAEESKNKSKNKQTTQKTVAIKKTTESNNKETLSKKADKNENVTVSKSLSSKKNMAKNKNEKEDKGADKEDWADIIDFELSDIVVLDEYDSTKTTEETTLKEMSEKEKTQLIRHHTLPSAPHIIVHPNRKAKEGKFDCDVKSLSVLLDYHPDDSKERFFEVSLFAELFNEMLIRDFGFTIYKEIYLYEEKVDTNNVSEITEVDTKIEKSEIVDEIKKESKGKDVEEEKPANKDAKSSNEDKSSKDHNNDDLQSIKSESRKRKISTSAATADDKEHESADSGKKMVVVKPQLLLSFVYFDTSHCGYIFDKHLEDLFYILGLNLSRSQIKNILGKIGKLDSSQPIYYRKLTDKEESVEGITPIKDVDDLPIEQHKRIAAGNNQYESVFGINNVHNQVSAIGGDDNNTQGLVNFNGAIVHVGKLLNQINRTEKNYSDLEKLHNDLRKQHIDLQKDHNKSTTKIKDMQAEIKTVSRKLTDANQDIHSLNRKYKDQHSTLSYIYTRVEPYFMREKDKDKDAKTEGSRDKDKDKNKSKDKESEKEKPKEDKEKDKAKEEKEKEIKKSDNRQRENAKDVHEGQTIKADREKDDKDQEKAKHEKEQEKEKLKDQKANEENKVNEEENKECENMEDSIGEEQTKSEKEKLKPTENKQKLKDDKEKQTTKDIKVKSLAAKNIEKKPLTPAAKKPTESKAIGKVIKKGDNVDPKK